MLPIISQEDIVLKDLLGLFTLSLKYWLLFENWYMGMHSRLLSILNRYILSIISVQKLYELLELLASLWLLQLHSVFLALVQFIRSIVLFIRTYHPIFVWVRVCGNVQFIRIIQKLSSHGYYLCRAHTLHKSAQACYWSLYIHVCMCVCDWWCLPTSASNPARWRVAVSIVLL